MYADDNPVNKIDPSGKDALLCGLTLSVAGLGILLGAWIAISALATAGPEGLIAGFVLTSAGQTFAGAVVGSIATGLLGFLIAYVGHTCP